MDKISLNPKWLFSPEANNIIGGLKVCGNKSDEFIQILFKEIDLVQGCINRMAANSFEIKKWTIGLIAILIGWLGKDGTIYGTYEWLFLMITGVFWSLDAFFLRVERLYRFKYEWIIKNRSPSNLENLFDLNPYNKAMLVDPANADLSIWSVMISKTLTPFYGGLIVLCVAMYFCIK